MSSLPSRADTVHDLGQQRVTHGRRDVVTAFLRREDNSVLLVKRSEKVGTYKLHWGGISGVVEGDEALRQRAETEIYEEVGYSPSEIAFVRTGRPLFVDDGRLHFAVHPYLFDLVPEATGKKAPTINWENVDAQFIKPEDIPSLLTVPQLSETLQRTSLTDFQERALCFIADDRSKGAAELAHQALHAFDEAVDWRCREHSAGDKGMSILEDMRNFGYHLAACRPSMAAVANTIAHILATAHEELHSRASPFECTSQQVHATLKSAVKATREKLKTCAEGVQCHTAELLRDGITVMTISRSSSVLNAVLTALKGGKRVQTIVCESRPLCEGLEVAKTWAQAGANTSVITDAQAAVFMNHIDCVLVGADAITEEGIYNKSGTMLLALAARHANKPFYVLADTMKLSPGSLESLAHPGGFEVIEMVEEKDAAELQQGWPGASVGRDVAIRNVYFELVPLDLLSSVVTEEGALDTGSVQSAINRWKEMYINAFQLR